MNGKYILGHFFGKVEKSTKFGFVASQGLRSWHGTSSSLHLKASLAYKLAKGMCLARTRDK